MKKIFAILLFTAAMISLNAVAQDVDKLAVRVQKESARVAEAFSLSKKDAATFEKILYTRFQEQKALPGMTEQEKFDARKAAAIAFRKNLEEAFGKDQGAKMTIWYSQNIVKKATAKPAAGQSADDQLKAKVHKEATMLAEGLNLSKEDAEKYEKILYQRFVDMRAINKDMSEEEKYNVRKAAVVKANEALIATFGKPKAQQMMSWYTNNIVKKKK